MEIFDETVRLDELTPRRTFLRSPESGAQVAIRRADPAALAAFARNDFVVLVDERR